MSGKDYSFLKTKLSEILINEITPIGKEIEKLLKDKAYLTQILKGKKKPILLEET